MNESLTKVRELLDKINYHYQAIDKLDTKVLNQAKKVLKELKTINGWEHLIQDCLDHYRQYPDKFFDWCEVSYDEDTIVWEKHYSNGDDCIVLEIDTNRSLQEQVDEAVEEFKKKYIKRVDDTRTKDMEEYYRIKEKYNL